MRPGTQAFSQEMYKKLIEKDDAVHWTNVKEDVLNCPSPNIGCVSRVA